MIKFVKLNPSGNITALVLNTNIKQELYKKIASDILKKYKDVEQVGFLKVYDKLFCLEMMGMEFCGNASRAFASFLVKNGDVKENEFYFSTSGIDKPILASVKMLNTNSYFSSIAIPFFKKINDIIAQNVVDNVEVFVVSLNGITHILVNEEKYAFDKKNYTKQAKYFINYLGLKNASAVGVIWFKKYKIKPVVWVKNTNTYYYENSCGSGSLALGIYYASFSDKKNFNIVQKNGQFISVSVLLENNIVKSANIAGNVEICGIYSI